MSVYKQPLDKRDHDLILKGKSHRCQLHYHFPINFFRHPRKTKTKQARSDDYNRSEKDAEHFLFLVDIFRKRARCDVTKSVKRKKYGKNCARFVMSASTSIGAFSNEQALQNTISDTIELDENSPVAIQPHKLKNVTMKQHQLALLHRCYVFENDGIQLRRNGQMKTKMGVIGDKVGSGKSFVILAIVLSDTEPARKPSRMSHAMDMVHVTRLMDRASVRDAKTNLLVIPHNLCLQWSECIRHHSSEDMIYFIVSKSAHLAVLADSDISNYDLILVTSTFYNAVANLINSRFLRLRRVIFDEADNMKIVRSQKIAQCRFTWFVTASYTNLVLDYFPRRQPESCGISSTGFIREVFEDAKSTMYEDDLVSLVVKNRDEFVDNSFALPDIISHVIECKNSYVIDILRGNIDAALLERLNAEDIHGAIRLVDPDNIQTEENIVDILVQSYITRCGVLDARIEHYRNRKEGAASFTFTSSASCSSDNSENGNDENEHRRSHFVPSSENIREEVSNEREGAALSSQQQTMTLPRRKEKRRDDSGFVNENDNNNNGSNNNRSPRQQLEDRISPLLHEKERIECRIASIRERITGCDVCTICYEKFNNKTVTKCCTHPYCFGCINMWLSSQKFCPMCKAPLDLSKLLVVDDTKDRQQEERGGLHTRTDKENDSQIFPNVRASNPKLINFESMIEQLNAQNRKILVFSNYDTSLTKVREVLDGKRIEHGTIKGTVNNIRCVLESYKNGSLNVLLANASDYGSGLNLQNTTDIIMFHKFNDSIEKQVIGRAQRCGRTCPLNVWYLLHANEIES